MKKRDIKKQNEEKGLIIGLVIAEVLIVTALLAIFEYTKQPARGLDAELGQISPLGRENCTDSDNGKNYYIKGNIYNEGETIIKENIRGEVINVSSPTHAQLRLLNGTWIDVVLNGEYNFGFGEGIINEINFISIGNPENSLTVSYTRLWDTCFDATLVERVCEDDIDIEFICPNDCQDGACIREQGPDPSVYFGQYNSAYILNEENQIPVIVNNYGTETATNVYAYLYAREYIYDKESGIWYWEYGLIGYALAGDIGIEEQKEVNINYIPNELGYVNLYVNISSDEDVNENDNEDFGYTRVVRNDIDAKVDDFVIYNQFPIVGENTSVSITVENLGIEISGAQLSLYDDDFLVGAKEINISSDIDYRERKKIEWNPTKNGYHTLKVEVVVAGDVNLSNNQLEKTFYVYGKTNVTANIMDNQNNQVTRYIYAEIFQEAQDGNGPITIEGEKILVAANLSETGETFDMGIYHIDGGDPYSTSGGVMILVFKSSFNDAIAIISEFYNKTTDGNRDYYFVFANRISTGLETSYYGFSFNKSYLKKLGVGNISTYHGADGETLTGDYDFVYCSVFNFTSKKCAGIWKKAEIMDINDGGESIFILGKAYYNMEAFALTDFLGFDGNTTNVSEEADIISNFTIERAGYGKIKLMDSVNISRFKLNPNLLTYYVGIGLGKISVQTDYLPELADKTARLTFWNINMHNPQLKYNGAACPNAICNLTAYDSSTKTFVANVNKFSSFEIVEGPYCGDGVCNGDEECDKCVADCGDCGEDGGGTYSCIPSWNCTWTLCVNNRQTLNCVDRNSCGTTSGRPSNHGTTQFCVIEQNCTDNDGDGYGIGTDCKGPDIDDNNPGITDTLTSDDMGSQDTGSSFIEENRLFLIILLVSSGVILAIVLITILIIYASNKHYKKKSNIKVSEIKRKIKDI